MAGLLQGLYMNMDMNMLVCNFAVDGAAGAPGILTLPLLCRCRIILP